LRITIDGLLEDVIEVVGFEEISITLVELVHVLNPMESQAMQGALQAVHAQDDAESSAPEEVVS
jgi:hypothetical protein